MCTKLSTLNTKSYYKIFVCLFVLSRYPRVVFPIYTGTEPESFKRNTEPLLSSHTVSHTGLEIPKDQDKIVRVV